VIRSNLTNLSQSWLVRHN